MEMVRQSRVKSARNRLSGGLLHSQVDKTEANFSLINPYHTEVWYGFINVDSVGVSLFYKGRAVLVHNAI